MFGQSTKLQNADCTSWTNITLKREGVRMSPINRLCQYVLAASIINGAHSSWSTMQSSTSSVKTYTPSTYSILGPCCSPLAGIDSWLRKKLQIRHSKDHPKVSFYVWSPWRHLAKFYFDMPLRHADKVNSRIAERYVQSIWLYSGHIPQCCPVKPIATRGGSDIDKFWQRIAPINS
jgi:hypothetical protein